MYIIVIIIFVVNSILITRAGVMKFDGPAGRSSHAEKTREPLQLMVHAQTDPAGQFSAGTPFPSDDTPRHFWWFVQTVFYRPPADPENHNGPLMRLSVLIVITVAPVVLNGQRLAHLPPDERIAV